MSYNNDILKIFRSYLHLGPLDRIVAVFPAVPGHSSSIDFTTEVQTIQIGVVTNVVPPGAFPVQGNLPPLHLSLSRSLVLNDIPR